MKFQVPATISKIMTMADKSLRLQVDTQELSPDDKANVFGLHDLYGWFMFSESSFKEEDLDLPDIPKPKNKDNDKSKSQYQRNLLHVFWEKRGKKDLYGRDCDTETFYNQYMDSHCKKIKNGINELE